MFNRSNLCNSLFWTSMSVEITWHQTSHATILSSSEAPTNLEVPNLCLHEPSQDDKPYFLTNPLGWLVCIDEQATWASGKEAYFEGHLTSRYPVSSHLDESPYGERPKFRPCIHRCLVDVDIPGVVSTHLALFNRLWGDEFMEHPVVANTKNHQESSALFGTRLVGPLKDLKIELYRPFNFATKSLIHSSFWTISSNWNDVIHVHCFNSRCLTFTSLPILSNSRKDTLQATSLNPQKCVELVGARMLIQKRRRLEMSGIFQLQTCW